MKQIIYISFFVFYFFTSCSSLKMDANSSFKTITGFVFDASDMQPLPGSYIKVKGSEKTATTDVDGKFHISVKENDVLIIGYIGFQNKKINITTQNEYKIILEVSKNVCKKCKRKKNREIKKYVRNGGRFIPSEEP